MSRDLTRRGKTALVAAGLTFGWALAGSHYLRINHTTSMPVGLWGVGSAGYAISRGDAVLLCLPEPVASVALGRGYIAHGECPGDTELLLKRVAAVAGDRVSVTPDGLAVNGVSLPDTAQRAADTLGRPVEAVAPGSYVVGPGMLWLVSSHSPRSYDSRYFGQVPDVGVRGIAFPILVKN